MVQVGALVGVGIRTRKLALGVAPVMGVVVEEVRVGIDKVE